MVNILCIIHHNLQIYTSSMHFELASFVYYTSWLYVFTYNNDLRMPVLLTLLWGATSECQIILDNSEKAVYKSHI